MEQDLDTQLQKAYGYALFLLNIRLRTEGELIEKLKTKKYSDLVIEKTLADLHGLHYLDDVRFAEVYIQNLRDYKVYGFYKIRQKLLEKRLPRRVVDTGLEEFFSLIDEEKVAKKFLGKYAPLFMTEPDSFSYQEKQKLAGKLQARGFRSEVVSKLLFS